MGICSSCQSASVVTAKLILDDGRLQEFHVPVKVSYLLQKNPACFICNSDDMEFDDVVSAVGPDEELQLGQLYFALPLTCLRRRLHAEDMAALAVKATSALKKTGCGGACNQMLAGEFKTSRRRVAEGGESRRRSGVGGRRRGKITAKLTVIPE